MTEQDAVNDLEPLYLIEGFVLDHDANLISTIHVDLRSPDERTPIGAVVKYSEAQFAIERSRTVQVARPPFFRKKGETQIYDECENLVTKKTVVRREAPAELQEASIQALSKIVDEAAESVGLTMLSKDITMRDATITDTDEHTIEWGNDDFWIYCTAMEPTTDDEHQALLASLDSEYDPSGTYILSPRTFAQMLARAYAGHYSAIYDSEDPFEHTIGGRFVGNTYHRKIGVIHGPVLYVDDPYEVCASALNAQHPIVRTMLPIFVKHKDYAAQREYRFVIPDKRQPEVLSKVMPVPPELLTAVGRHGDSKVPMVIPDFHVPGGTAS